MSLEYFNKYRLMCEQNGQLEKLHNELQSKFNQKVVILNRMHCLSYSSSYDSFIQEGWAICLFYFFASASMQTHI